MQVHVTYEGGRCKCGLTRHTVVHVHGVSCPAIGADIFARQLHAGHRCVLPRDISFTDETFISVERHLRLAVNTRAHLNNTCRDRYIQIR